MKLKTATVESSSAKFAEDVGRDVDGHGTVLTGSAGN